MNSLVNPGNAFVEFAIQETEQSIPQRFEKIVRAYPDRVAVKTKNDIWTYESINSAANRITEEILNRVGTGNEPVAMLIERGASVLVAVLAVLKAGKIYVPLEPSYPLERLRFILHDAQPQLILTSGNNSALCQALSGEEIPIVSIDELSMSTGGRSPGVTIGPDALAYILYTSGSTGQPKGVVDNHRNVLHGTLRFTNGLHICAEDRFTFTHSCSSSASVRRIFPALLNGASLHPLDITKAGMTGLVDLLERERITYFSTGRIRDFVRTLSAHHRFDELRLVSFGGEVVYKTDVDLYRKIFPPRCLIGIWMSTTETGNITQYFISSETQLVDDIAPIGYPVEGIEVVLLDDEHRAVSQGDVGEITVRSRYLSPGYWRQPDLTKASFEDVDASGERIYFTGDLGRMDPQGCLYHLGRKDDRAKIRGYRVESAETEAALLKLPGVRKAFVTARERQTGDKQLVGYVVPEDNSSLTVTTLRKALATSLPDYMIPSVFVILNELPLTPTGKVDRKALPAPSKARPALDTFYVAPRTPLEEDLVRLWDEILSLDHIGINDSFFELGGDSLSAVRLISAILRKFQTRLPVRVLFQSPTVAEMAVVLTTNVGNTLSEDELARMVTELESLTDEDAQHLLATLSSTVRSDS
jgi:amino acid adenylation domain-containing protein